LPTHDVRQWLAGDAPREHGLEAFLAAFGHRFLAADVERGPVHAARGRQQDLRVEAWRADIGGGERCGGLQKELRNGRGRFGGSRSRVHQLAAFSAALW
jgi:hypothetical protein